MYYLTVTKQMNPIQRVNEDIFFTDEESVLNYIDFYQKHVENFVNTCIDSYGVCKIVKGRICKDCTIKEF